MFGIGAGVQFDDGRTQRPRHIELLLLGIDEQRYANTRLTQSRNERPQMVVPADHVETAFGGDLGPLLRHQAHSVRLDL